MKKRTLNQTWTLCLRMWKRIAKEWDGDVNNSVWDLKFKWLKENEFIGLKGACFFCDVAGDDCYLCPGYLVDSSFVCSNDSYDYESNPVAFYKELLRLNRIRKAKK